MVRLLRLTARDPGGKSREPIIRIAAWRYARSVAVDVCTEIEIARPRAEVAAFAANPNDLQRLKGILESR